MAERIGSGADALRELLDVMSPSERERLVIMERVKSRILRTPDRDDEAAAMFRKLLADLVTRLDGSRPLGPGNRIETRALVVTGKPGAGKTTLIARTINDHPAFGGFGTPFSGCRAVAVMTPSPCNPKALGLEILRVLGFPMAAQSPIPAIWGRVRDRLDFLGKTVLCLDEVHNVLETANVRELTQIRTLLKGFLVSPTWPVVLVLSGLPEVIPFFEGLNDPDGDDMPRANTKGEVRRRANFMSLQSLRMPADNPMVAAAVGDMAGVASLGVPANLESEIAPRLVHASVQELGTTMQLAHEAIGQALDATPRATELGLDHFRLAYRERTGCSDAANPFATVNWRKLDCTLLGRQTGDAVPAAGPRRKRR